METVLSVLVADTNNVVPLAILVGLVPIAILVIYGAYVVKTTKKDSLAIVNSMSEYLNNLGFKPTRICATSVVIKYVSEYSQKTLNALSEGMTVDKTYSQGMRDDKTYSNMDGCRFPELGIFMNANKKVFAVRSDIHEITPKVYSFSQLQDFEVSRDIRENRRGAIYSHGIAIGFGGGLKGTLSMRVVFNGTNGPEWITLQPRFGSKKLSTNHPIYKLILGELTSIADCLQWIHNNA